MNQREQMNVLQTPRTKRECPEFRPDHEPKAKRIDWVIIIFVAAVTAVYLLLKVRI